MNKYIVYLIFIFFIFFGCKEEKDTGQNEIIKTETPWYQQPMRIAALQCNFDDEDNMAVIDKWVDMGFNVEQLFHPMAEYYSALYKPGEHKEILTEYVKKAHQKGLKIILYLNIHILGPSFEHNKEIWSQYKKDGSISYLYKTYPSVCLNSPWRDHFFSVLDSLKAIDIDGIFLDGPVIANGGCYCETCKAKYKAMFDGKPGTESGKRWEFNAYTKDNFLQDVYDHFKKDSPEKIVYMNFPITDPKRQYVNIENGMKYNDIIGTEGGFMFYGPAKNSFLWRPSFTSKLLEAFAPDKPRVIFMAADHKPWSWWMHSPLETMLCITSVTANGANIWYGLHGSSKLLKTPSAEAAREVVTFYSNNEELLTNTHSIADVALFHSFANTNSEKSDFVESTLDKTHGNTEDAARGYYSMLTESQIPFDIITDYKLTAEKISRYKVLVIPNVLAFDKNSENIIRKFVKNGGLLITELGTSLYDVKGNKESDFSLSDVFGISTKGEYKEHDNYNYFVFESGGKHAQNIKSPFIPLPLLTMDVSAKEGTEIICRALKDLRGRYVPLTIPEDIFLTSNKFGEGTAIYIAGNFGEMYNEYHVIEYKALINDILSEKLNNGITFENAPTNLEVVLREQDGRKMLHLINYQAGPTRPLETVTPVQNLKIKIPLSWNVTNVTSKKMNAELDIKTNESYVEVTLPDLQVYDILVIE